MLKRKREVPAEPSFQPKHQLSHLSIPKYCLLKNQQLQLSQKLSMYAFTTTYAEKRHKSPKVKVRVM